MQAAAASIPKEAWDDRAVLDKLPGWMQLIVNLKEEMGALMAGVGGANGNVAGPFGNANGGIVGEGGLQTRESIREAAESFVQKVLGEGGGMGLEGLGGAAAGGFGVEEQLGGEGVEDGGNGGRVWDVGDML